MAMGKLKLFFIVLCVLVLGGVAGAFIMANNGAAVSVDLLFFAPINIKPGVLSLYCFFTGLFLGICLASVYIVLQRFELMTAKRVNKKNKKQITGLEEQLTNDASRID